MNIRVEEFTDELDQAIKFRQELTEDPHNLNLAVIVALSEVKEAWLKAFPSFTTPSFTIPEPAPEPAKPKKRRVGNRTR